MVQSYLDMLGHMRELTSDPRGALLMAQNSMKEIYEKTGKKADAVKELRQVLDRLQDPTAQTAVRFALADLYKEIGQYERALEQLREIVAENKALLEPRERGSPPPFCPRRRSSRDVVVGTGSDRMIPVR